MSELGERLSPQDFFTYMAYFSLVPVDEDAFYHSQLMWATAQVHSSKTLKSETFYPDWFGDQRRASGTKTLNPMVVLSQIANAGGKINRK